jgi:hypothetical protein
MPNPTHVELVKKGTPSIAEWRDKNKEADLDLSKADLSKAHLPNADLAECDLSGANLSEAFMAWSSLAKANLSGASLRKTNLAFCCLARANLSNSDLSGAQLFGANLTRANLTGARFQDSYLGYCTMMSSEMLKTDLRTADLEGAVLCDLVFANADLSHAIMSDTIISNSSLFGGKGLETVNHNSSSHVDLSTLLKSFSDAGNCIPHDIETFLLGTGVPKQLIDSLPKIITNIEYCSCFVAYGEPDKAYAEKLKRDFVAKGLSCWVYSLDATPGERTWPEISQRRREAEKMIVLCSAKSLVRDGVLKEIEEQIDENPDKLVPISLDDTWKEPGFQVKRGARDLKTWLLERNYADFSDEAKYKKEFDKLLKGLMKRRT